MLYTPRPRRRRPRASRIAYPLLAGLLMFALGALWTFIGAPMTGQAEAPPARPPWDAGLNVWPTLTPGPSPTPGGSLLENIFAPFLPTATPQNAEFRSQLVGIGADCQQTMIFGTVHSGIYGVNGLRVRAWEPTTDEVYYSNVTGSDTVMGAGGYSLRLDTAPRAGQWLVTLVDELDSAIADSFPLITTATGCDNSTGQQVVQLNFVRERGERGELVLLPLGNPPTPTPAPTPPPPIVPLEPTQVLVWDGANRQVQVPILMYHYLSVPPSGADSIRRGLSVGPDVFRAQLITLREQGYTSITLRQLAEAMLNGTPLPPRPIVLTFDDGYRDNYTFAFPILKEEGFVGTFLIFTDPVEQWNNDYMTWPMLTEIQQAGNEIGSHTLSHADLPSLTEEGVRREVAESKRILEERLGVPVVSLAYPYGRTSDGVSEIVKASGYWIAVTTRGGQVHDASTIHGLERVRVAGGMFPEQLMNLLGDCSIYEECP